jgi:hypothetical protein
VSAATRVAISQCPTYSRPHRAALNCASRSFRSSGRRLPKPHSLVVRLRTASFRPSVASDRQEPSDLRLSREVPWRGSAGGNIDGAHLTLDRETRRGFAEQNLLFDRRAVGIDRVGRVVMKAPTSTDLRSGARMILNGMSPGSFTRAPAGVSRQPFGKRYRLASRQWSGRSEHGAEQSASGPHDNTRPDSDGSAKQLRLPLGLKRPIPAANRTHRAPHRVRRSKHRSTRPNSFHGSSG